MDGAIMIASRKLKSHSHLTERSSNTTVTPPARNGPPSPGIGSLSQAGMASEGSAGKPPPPPLDEGPADGSPCDGCPCDSCPCDVTRLQRDSVKRSLKEASLIPAG